MDNLLPEVQDSLIPNGLIETVDNQSPDTIEHVSNMAASAAKSLQGQYDLPVNPKT